MDVLYRRLQLEKMKHYHETQSALKAVQKGQRVRRDIFQTIVYSKISESQQTGAEVLAKIENRKGVS
jgi:hypothetical protein